MEFEISNDIMYNARMTDSTSTLKKIVDLLIDIIYNMANTLHGSIANSISNFTNEAK